MNKNKIIAIIMLVVGILFLLFGAYSIFKDNNKDISKQPSNAEPNDENNNEEELPEDYTLYEEGLIFSNFKVSKSEEDETLLNFYILNNTDTTFKTKIMKINIYDSKNELLDTYEYEITNLDAYDEIGIEASMALKYESNYSYEVVLGENKVMVKANTDSVYKIN